MSGDINGLRKFVSDTESGLQELNKLFKSETINELSKVAPTVKEKLILKGIGSTVKLSENATYRKLSDE